MAKYHIINDQLKGEIATLMQKLTDLCYSLYPDYPGVFEYTVDDKGFVDLIIAGTTHDERMNGVRSFIDWIESGRGPGKPPPHTSILNWIRKYGIQPNDPEKYKDDEHLAYAIATSIAQFGIEGKHKFANISDQLKALESSFVESFSRSFMETLDSMVKTSFG